LQKILLNAETSAMSAASILLLLTT